MKRKLSILLCLLLFVKGAISEEFIIPDGTIEVQEEAFLGCSSMNRIVIPGSVTTIGDDAFLDCGEALWIITEPGSAAIDYAVSNQIDYNADTRYRALLVCQTYPDTYRELEGPIADKAAMRGCLEASGFTVRAESNISADGIISAVQSTFSLANSNDVSLFYYSGHGDDDGSLIGADEGFSILSPAELRSAMDTIPGRKVIIVDACFSGKLIEEKITLLRAAPTGLGSLISSFQSAFRPKIRGAFNADQYFVITAAQANEESMEALVGTKVMGLFTYSFCLGCGWDSIADCQSAYAADINGDQAVSIQEAFAFAKTIPVHYDVNQTAAVWPTNCKWFAPFRR